MNEFFAVEDLPADRTGWTTLHDLADDPSGRIAATAAALGTDDLRVAASTDLLSLAARVLAPALLLTLDRSAVPRLSTVWWRHDRPAPMRIGWCVEGFSAVSAFGFVTSLVEPTLGPVVDGYCRHARLSAHIAWGNVASALNGAAMSIGDARAVAFVRDVLGVGTLGGTAQRLPPHFVRNSCCLFYRVPDGGLCGDCILRNVRTAS